MLRVVVFGIALLAAAAPAAEQAAFRTGTKTVPIYATVTDLDGRLVTDLTKNDFTVLDNGKPVPLSLFANDIQPITMVAMLDTSGSMADNVGLVRSGAMALVGNLLKEDRVRFGTFGGRIMLSPRFSSDRDELERFLLERLRPMGATPLWDAMDVAMDALAAETGRKVVLAFSDGNDTMSAMKMKEALKQALWDELMIYGIGCWGIQSGTKAEKPDGGLRKIAEETGGGYMELQWRDGLDASFRRVADELHRQYVLGFSPEKLDGKVHKLEIRVTRPGLIARARKSYVANP
jgi:Ca-activated chloride channel family protein